MGYYLFFLIYGIALSVILSLMSFLDLLNVIMKVLPNKKVEGYDEYKKLRSCNEYKLHRKKWSKIMAFTSSIGYIIAYVLVCLLTKKIALGLYVGIFVAVLFASRCKNKESKERKRIEMLMRSSDGYENQSGDGSMSSDEKD